MKKDKINNVIYPDIQQWKQKQKDNTIFIYDIKNDILDEFEVFMLEDIIRRQQNTIHHNKSLQLYEECKMEEAMLEWNKKK